MKKKVAPRGGIRPLIPYFLVGTIFAILVKVIFNHFIFVKKLTF